MGMGLPSYRSYAKYEEMCIRDRLASMKDILTVQDQNQIPELNEYQCGTYTEHSLEEAHEIAKNVIARGVGINKNDDLALDESFLK